MSVQWWENPKKIGGGTRVLVPGHQNSGARYLPDCSVAIVVSEKQLHWPAKKATTVGERSDISSSHLRVLMVPFTVVKDFSNYYCCCSFTDRLWRLATRKATTVGERNEAVSSAAGDGTSCNRQEFIKSFQDLNPKNHSSRWLEFSANITFWKADNDLTKRKWRRTPLMTGHVLSSRKLECFSGLDRNHNFGSFKSLWQFELDHCFLQDQM